MFKNLLIVKPVAPAAHVDAGEPVEGGLQGEVTLKRVLTARHLVLLGVGAAAATSVGLPRTLMNVVTGVSVAAPARAAQAGAAPGGDVVQQRKVPEVGRAVQRRTAAQQARRAHRKDLLVEQGCG